MGREPVSASFFIVDFYNKILYNIYKKEVIFMKTYKITEERLKELLHDHYVLNCLYDSGVDNWNWYMANRTEFINYALGRANREDWDEDADFEDIVMIDLTEYEEIEKEEEIC